MLPVIVIVGCPNVGKSTLFNCLTRTSDALVFDLPGTTRDRKYGEGKVGPVPYIVVDTGGLRLEGNALDNKTAEQSWDAIINADLVLFVVDGRAGIAAADYDIAQKLRGANKPILVVINKTEGLDPNHAVSDFFDLGFGNLIPISAAHNRGIEKLAQNFSVVTAKQSIQVVDEQSITIAIIGRPNVGKSTLINKILGEERMVVFDAPGTTRDSVFINMERSGCRYTLIDTAGVRRKSKVIKGLEKFSVIKTLQAIESSQVVVLLIDAEEGLVDQDLSLLQFAIEAGKCLVIAVNKWDKLSSEHKLEVEKNLKYKLKFANFADCHFISALNGTGIGRVFKSVNRAYSAATKPISTPLLTRILQSITKEHEPPLVAGRRIKLRYAHLGGRNPPCIVIHGNQLHRLPGSYKKYLINAFRRHLKLVGTPIRLELKVGENPYEGRKT